MRITGAAVLLLGVSACRDAGTEGVPVSTECWSLRTEDDLPGTTQTYDVALDPAGGRAVATGLGLPHLSVIDTRTGARTDAIAYAEDGLLWPHVAVDGQGTAWIASLDGPGLTRVDLATRTVLPVEGASGAGWVVGLVDGALAPRETTQQGASVARYDAAGTLVAERPVERARGGALHPDGVVVLADDVALVLDATAGDAALDVLSRCDLPFAPDFVVALDDGALVVADRARIGRVACGVGLSDTWEVGVEITELVTDGQRAWALDRIGPDDPTLGVTWEIGTSGAPVPGFVTGKNTGYGDVDRSTGALWANSEGTSEVRAWLLADGTELAVVSTGTFVDGLALAPDGALLATGRLSGLVARLDDGRVTRAAPVRWPWAPILAGGRLWVLAQLDVLVASLDPLTLGDTIVHGLGHGPNTLLTFDDLVDAPDRGTLLVAESAADVLLEVGTDGVVRAEWPLGGPAVDDPDEGAHLEVVYRDGIVWLARSYDGRLQRIDLATGVRTDAALDVERVEQLRDLRRTHAFVWDGERPRIGPWGLDPDTLEVVDAWEGVGALLTPLPDGRGWVAVDGTGRDLLRVEDGVVRRRDRWLDVRQPGTVALLDADGTGLWVNRAEDGQVCRVPLGDLGE
jgi:hypothetical protein